jgi:glycerate 2-kinase
MILNPHILNVASGAWIGSSNYPRKHNTVPTLRPPQRLFQQALYSTTSVEQDMKRDALQILDQAIRAVDPYTAVRSHFRVLDHNATLEIGSEKNATSRCLKDFDKIVVVSFGKASSAMATAVVQQLNGIELEKIEIYGAVICKDDHGTEEEETVLSSYGIKTMMASHPVPDERSVDAADYALKLVQEHASPKTLVICCISGGGSALFCKPRKGMTLQDLQDVNSALLASGMGIQECNVVRKRLEDGKGGRLAALSYPSLVVTLVLSDG